MENPNKPYPIKPVELQPVDMHGPLEVTATLYILLPDGRPATLNFKMESGQIPTRGKIAATMNAMMDPASMEESSIPPGTRLMTKPEFVAHITKKVTGGQAIPLPGDQHFVPVPPDVPHSMLVHAIAGAGFGFAKHGMELADEYEKRGLATHTGNQHNPAWEWSKEKLDALPDDVLLAIYERITG